MFKIRILGRAAVALSLAVVAFAATGSAADQGRVVAGQEGHTVVAVADGPLLDNGGPR
ncbi:hypothetical protein ACN261_18050 [Micromonospora sp. WMMD723]|uniref:hypothetical protein n=1 Tax=unclassified Micromonospora TaxID=2617518 RepID=UPI003B9240D1